IIYIYVIVSIVVAVTAFNAAGWQAGLSAFTTTVLVFFAGAGLRGSFFKKGPRKTESPADRQIRLAGIILAAIFLDLAHWLGKGFSVHFIVWDFTGTEWAWIGFLICFVCTSKRFAESMSR
ncbi:MAG: hypothetical protein WCH75_15610, partial [Candidatus Binatia bacterium]